MKIIKENKYYPESNEILDEYDFAWMGKSLLSSGVPTAWSDLGAYPDYKGKFNLEIKNFSITVDDKSPSFKNFRSFLRPLVKVETLD
ncbi:MAG: hypothetical protein NTV20_01300, partial [Candidatus Shapirobacteria bacterium]|nr:hypothetical protein [Candidatus Shapirobacteria bacterium]